MKNCPHCGEAVLEGTLFCMKCGSSLAQPAQNEQRPDGMAMGAAPAPVCAACGMPLVEGSMFCMKCGASATASATARADTTGGVPLETGVNSPVSAMAPPVVPDVLPTTPVAPFISPAAPPVAYAAQPVPDAAPPVTYAAPPVTYAAPPPAAVAETQPPPAETPPDTAKAKPFYKRPLIIAIAALLLVVIASAGYIIGTGAISFGSPASGAAGISRNSDYIAYIKDNELFVANIKSLTSFESSTDLLSGMSLNSIRGGYARYFDLVHMTKNGSRLFYPDRFLADGTYNLYTRTVSGGGKTAGDAARLDTDIRGNYLVSEDGKTVFYIKGEALTLYSNDLKDKTKIASDVESFVVDRKGTKLYYTDSQSNLYFRFKNNSPEKIDSDAVLVGESPDLAAIYYMKDGTLYKKKQNDAKEKIASGVSEAIMIYDSGEMYYSKEAEADGRTVDILYYYDGVAETKLGAGSAYTGYREMSASTPILIYTVDNVDAKTSDLTYRIAVKGKDAEIEVSKTFMYPTLNTAGTRLYYVDDYNTARQSGDLWGADVTDSGLSKATQIHDDADVFKVSRKGSLRYYSQINKTGDAAEYYIDGKFIDTDVMLYSDTEIADTGNIVYYSDYNMTKGRGTLKICIKNKPTRIADDVSEYSSFKEKSVIYLVVEGSSSAGDLMRFDGSKDRKRIASDVTTIVPVFNTGYSGNRASIYR